MMSMRQIWPFAVAAATVCIWLAGAQSASATLVAFDSAADAEYGSPPFSVWEDDQNGGFGFGPWDLDGEAGVNFAILSSTLNGDGDANMDGDIDTAGQAFGLAAPTGEFVNVTASREFAAALDVGYTFSLDMDNGSISSGEPGDMPIAGFSLASSSGERFVFFARAGSDSYFILDGNGEHETDIPLTDEGLSIAFTLISTEAYSLSVNGMQAGIGDLAMSGPITEFTLGTNAGNAVEEAVFFNNFAVTAVPEPAWIGGLGIVLATLVGWLGAAARRFGLRPAGNRASSRPSNQRNEQGRSSGAAAATHGNPALEQSVLVLGTAY